MTINNYYCGDFHFFVHPLLWRFSVVRTASSVGHRQNTRHNIKVKSALEIEHITIRDAGKEYRPLRLHITIFLSPPRKWTQATSETYARFFVVASNTTVFQFENCYSFAKDQAQNTCDDGGTSKSFLQFYSSHNKIGVKANWYWYYLHRVFASIVCVCVIDVGELDLILYQWKCIPGRRRWSP